MRFDPHPYQREGLRWIASKPRCCLFWQMGLGKTVVALTAVARLIDSCEVSKVLVVAPKKVAEATWSTEARHWDHLRRLDVVKVMGTERQRIAALSEGADVYVTGRDNLVWLMKHYKGRHPFDMIVIDELSSFKSPRSLRFKAMRMASAQASRVLGLTGTPAPNGLVDLWAQIYCIDLGERLGKFVTRYRQAYFNEQKWNHIVVRCTPKPGAEKEIRDRIGDICLSMQAEDYLTLPPLIVKDDMVSLPESVAKGYRQFERDRVMEFQSESGAEGDTMVAQSAAALMNKLSQWASGAVYDDEHQWHEVHSEKLARLREIVEASDSGVLVFYQYQHEADRIAHDLRAYEPRKYEGEKDLAEWNAGKVRLMMAHPASTAYGLNMQRGGNTVVWFGTGWNLELYQQANARLHRQGQQRPVTVVRLIARGTVDERAARAIDDKRQTQKALLDSLKELIHEYTKQKNQGDGH